MSLSPAGRILLPVGVGRPSSVASVYRFYDSFTAADGTLISARPPDVDLVGGGWVQYSGSINILTNRANILSAIGMYAFDVGLANITYRAVCSATGGGSFRFAVRLTNNNNYWQITGNPDGRFPSIIEVNAGVATLRAQGAGSIMTPPFNFQVVTLGNSISVSFYNGIITNSVSYGSATFNNTATRFGIRGEEAGATGPKYDNVEVPL